MEHRHRAPGAPAELRRNRAWKRRCARPGGHQRGRGDSGAAGTSWAMPPATGSRRTWSPRPVPGWCIDWLLASDLAGRFVAVRQGPCLQLVDLQDATTVVLPGADLRDVAESLTIRVLTSRHGKSLAYLRGGPAPRIVVRELPTGRETLLDPGRGLRAQLRFDDRVAPFCWKAPPFRCGRPAPDGARVSLRRPRALAWSASTGGRWRADRSRSVAGRLGTSPRSSTRRPCRRCPRPAHRPRPAGLRLRERHLGHPRRRARLGVTGHKREPFDDGPLPRGPLRWRR